MKAKDEIVLGKIIDRIDTIREDLPELRKRLCRIQEELGG